MSFPTITFCLIFSPLLRYKICLRRCSGWLASSPGTSDKGTEVTIVLGHGPIPYKHAPPLLGWKLCPFLGWMSSDIRLPSHGILGRAFPFTLLEPRAKLAHTVPIGQKGTCWPKRCLLNENVHVEWKGTCWMKMYLLNKKVFIEWKRTYWLKRCLLNENVSIDRKYTY